jgi:hypothetical protein
VTGGQVSWSSKEQGANLISSGVAHPAFGVSNMCCLPGIPIILTYCTREKIHSKRR